MLQSIINKLSRLIQRLPAGAIARKSPRASLEAMLFHFLDTGWLPRDSVYDRPDQLEAAILSLDSSRLGKLHNRIRPHLARRHVRLRLCRQFSQAFLESIISSILPFGARQLIQIGRRCMPDSSPAVFKEILLNAAIDASERRCHSEEDLTRCIIRQQQLQIQRENESETRYDKTTSANIPEGFEEKEPLYVPYAGIVLLNPFLQPFFFELKLINRDHQFKSVAAHTRAVHLLHYLAAGDQNPAENQTVLFKYICGYPNQIPLVKDSSLSTGEKDEARDLLTSALRYWTRLKNTSIEGLRETFFQREGRLTFSDTGLHLVVERRPVDVLLDHLPWSISRIKFPWLPVQLNVEW